MNYAVCPVPSTGGAFLATLLRNLDCQGQTLGSAGYQALANPAAPLSIALTALLTIFVALFGIRLLLGHIPALREGVVAAVKIGIVLLLATSWPAYRTVVYNVVIQGPGELAADIGGSAAIPGADGSLIERLQVVDNAIAALTTLGSGREDLMSAPPAGPDGKVAPMQRTPISDDLAFGLARVFFLVSAIGAFGIARLGAGVLLALAPLFAGLLLFEVTCGVFAGWLRSLFALMLAALATTTALGVELSLLEPWLADTLSQRASRFITPQAPIELLVLCLAFGAIVFGCMWVIAKVAFGLHIPSSWTSTFRSAQLAGGGPERRWDQIAQLNVGVGQSRALAVADAISVSQRREALTSPALRSAGAAPVDTSQGAAPRGASSVSVGVKPLGQGFRRTRTRTSQSSTLRDRR